MKFTVTYRDKAGTISATEIEASSRPDAFDMLKSRGIVPLKLVQGAAAPMRHVRGRNARRFLLPAACASAAIVVGVAVFLYFSAGEKNAGTPAKNRSGRIAEVVPTKKGHAQTDNQNPKTNVTEVVGTPIAVKKTISDEPPALMKGRD